MNFRKFMCFVIVQDGWFIYLHVKSLAIIWLHGKPGKS